MNKEIISDYIQESINVKKELLEKEPGIIAKVAEVVTMAVDSGHVVFWFGNGGSAADAQHLSAELVGRFVKERKALPSIALTTNTSVLTAIGNDYNYDQVFARQVEAFVKPGDVVVGISTSGNSDNVVIGLKAAKKMGAITIAMTGQTGGKLKGKVDYLLAVPSTVTSHIQESHIMIGHLICYLVEKNITECQ